MKINTIILLIIANLSYAQTPTFEWARNFGSYRSIAVATVVDISGNTYTLGSFEGTGDFDSSTSTFNLTSANKEDIYITKYDSNGNFVWAKSFGSSTDTDVPTAITLDNSGNLYATGNFIGTGDFNPDSGIENLTSVFYAGVYRASTFILKLDTDGNFIWAKNLTAGLGNFGTNIKVDASNNIIIGGNYYYQIDFDPGAGSTIVSGTSSSRLNIYILKLDSAGNYIWGKSMNGNGNTKTTGLVVDTNNDIISTGIFKSTIDFDPNATIFNMSAAADDIFILKIDANGNFSWAKSIGGIGSDKCIGIAADANNNYYLTGTFYGTVDFDTSSNVFNLVTTPTLTTTNTFIAKINSDGGTVWAKKVGGTSIADDVYAIATDVAGNVYTTGLLHNSLSPTTDFDPGPNVFTFNTQTYDDAYYLKLDTNGNFSWAIGYSGNWPLVRYPYSIQVDASGVVYSAGGFGSNNSTGEPIDFDFSSGIYLLNSTSRSFMLKFNQSINSGLKNLNQLQTTIFPNPTTSSINLNLANSIENGTLKIISITGQTILEKQNLTGTDFNLDVSGLSNGNYILQLKNRTSISTSKFVKQ